MNLLNPHGEAVSMGEAATTIPNPVPIRPRSGPLTLMQAYLS